MEVNSTGVALPGDGEDRRMHTVDLYPKVRLAFRDGMSARAVTRYLGIVRWSVRKMLRFSVPP